jgi:phosphate transport system permease protein
VSASLPSRSSLRPRSTRRRVADRAATIVLGLGTALALVPLVLVVWFLVRRGISTWSVAFFTTDPVGAAGGIRSAIVGTFELVLIATVLAVPVAISMAVFLIEFGRESAFAGAVRSVIDVMAGVPSVVIGLFVYSALVLSGTGGSFAAWKGAVALALVMLPIITRTAEVELERVPDDLRAGAVALGAPRWRVIVQMVLPAAAGGLMTASLLAVARATGETAPLIFTVAAAQALTLDPGAATNSLPLQILHDVQHPAPGAIARAWGAALTLVILVCLANLAARLISRRPPPG